MKLGQLKPDYASCSVSGGQHEIFEVLENSENASLIYWVPWLKFHPRPNGAVVVDSSFDSVFIGRTKSASGLSHNIGKIEYGGPTGLLTTYNDTTNETETLSHGEILLEIEPVGYKLENIQLDIATEHIRQLDPEIIDERVLRNDGEDAATVTTEISYSYSYTLSWGHGHGIAIGLNTSIEMADGTLLPQIQWANLFSENITNKMYKLERYLEPGTACNVTFRGNKTERDVQYTAKLITLYDGKDSRSRQMRGQRIENTLEVEPVFGEIYFVGNNSLVPTTTTTTTTTTTSTTTPAPETVPPSPEENDIPSAIKKGDATNEVDTGGMMGDSSDGHVKTPSAKDDNLNRAVVGGLGSNQAGGADTTKFTIALLIPLFALLL